MDLPVFRWIVLFVLSSNLRSADGFCNNSTNGVKILMACQNNSATGTVIHLDSDGAPQNAISTCECVFTHTEQIYKVFVSTKKNNYDGVVFEIAGQTFLNNSVQPSVEMQSGSIITFKKTVMTEGPRLCNGLIAGNNLPNFTITCYEGDVQVVIGSSTTPKATSTTSTLSSSSTSTTMTYAPTTTAKQTSIIRQSTTETSTTSTTNTKGSTHRTNPASSSTMALTVTERSTSSNTEITSLALSSPINNKETRPPATEQRSDPDGFGGTVDIVIVVAVGVGVFLVLFAAIFTCTRKKKGESKMLKEPYHTYINTDEPNYTLTENNMYESTEYDTYHQSVEETDVYPVQMHITQDGAEYAAVNVNRNKKGEGDIAVQSVFEPLNAD